MSDFIPSLSFRGMRHEPQKSSIAFGLWRNEFEGNDILSDKIANDYTIDCNVYGFYSDETKSQMYNIELVVSSKKTKFCEPAEIFGNVDYMTTVNIVHLLNEERLCRIPVYHDTTPQAAMPAFGEHFLEQPWVVTTQQIITPDFGYEDPCHILSSEVDAPEDHDYLAKKVSDFIDAPQGAVSEFTRQIYRAHLQEIAAEENETGKTASGEDRDDMEPLENLEMSGSMLVAVCVESVPYKAYGAREMNAAWREKNKDAPARIVAPFNEDIQTPWLYNVYEIGVHDATLLAADVQGQSNLMLLMQDYQKNKIDQFYKEDPLLGRLAQYHTHYYEEMLKNKPLLDAVSNKGKMEGYGGYFFNS